MPQFPGDTVIHQMLDAGSSDFAAVWRAWIAQFTQPQLLKISDAYLGARIFHSSQMGGFARRSLRNPAPLVFIAVGYLNTAHGRSLGIPDERIEVVRDIGLPHKLPGHLSDLWQGKQPLLDANDIVMGPTGLFEAFSGLRGLLVNNIRELPSEDAPAASAAVGKLLRLHLGAKGVDWIAELPQLRNQCSGVEELLLGKTITSDRLLTQLPRLAVIAGTTEDALWEEIKNASSCKPTHIG